jgi:hypothetical protein
MRRASSTVWPTRQWRLIFLAFAFVASSTALGATLQPKLLEQLIDDADVIVRGTVQAVTSGPRVKGAPGTTVVLAVHEQWKRSRLSTLRLVQPGGSEGGLTHAVPGLPTFRVGEEVILFLEGEGGAQYSILGGKQGKFSIQTDPRTGKRVIEDLTGARSDLTQFLARLGAPAKAGP